MWLGLWTFPAPLPAREEPRDLTLHWQVAPEKAPGGETTGSPRAVVPEDLQAWLWWGSDREGPSPSGEAANGEAAAGYRAYPLAGPSEAIEPGADPEPPVWDLKGACRPGATLLLVSPERMTLPLTLLHRHCEEGVEVGGLVDRATVAGRVLPPVEDASRGEAPLWQAPPAGWLEAEKCSMDPRGGRRPPPVRVPLRVEDTGEWWLPVPARECQHLTLKLGELSPATWWGVILEPGGETALETRRLERGASILVQVTSDQDGRPLAGVEVAALDEATAARGTAETEGTAPPPVAVATTGEWGWARLSGLGEGFYVVRARQEESGAMADSELLESVAARETVVDLELRSPAALTVELDPEAELPVEDPAAHVWLFEGSKESWTGTRAVTSESPAGEPQVFPRLSPGSWVVVVFLEGTGFDRQEIFSRDLRLAPGEDRRLVVTPDRPLRRGRVLLRGEPVPGEVRFKRASTREDGDAGEEDDRVSSGFFSPTARSDQDGRFDVFLPAGLYQVQVRPEQEARLVTTPPIEVAPGDGELLVRLPGGRLSGWVVDAAGEPVADPGWAALRLADDDERYEPLIASGAGAADGSFVVDALAAGSWQIQARSRDGREGGTEVTLGPDEVREGVEIVVGEEAVVSGRLVTSSGRPVAMARGSGFVVSPSGGLPNSVELTTDARGRFELDVPFRPGAELHLQITAPGIPLDALRVRLEDQLELVVSGQGGRVRLTGSTGRGVADMSVLLSSTGGVLDPRFYGGNQGGEVVFGEGEVIIPNLAAGAWRVVSLPTPQAMRDLFRGDFSGLRTLATFVVEPGGSVEVSLD